MHERDVRAIIRQQWGRPERVEGWMQGRLYREFAEPAIRPAWKAALRAAAGTGARRPGRSAVDVGTGPGTIAEFWAELGFATTGLDFSPAMLQAARRAAAERELAITYARGDAEWPKLPAGLFDVVSSRFVLFTLTHPGLALRRWVELLRPGGALVLIGHDRPDGADGPRQPGSGDRRRHHRRGHQHDPRHQEALRRLPFRGHDANTLIVVMEALGLRGIRRVGMEQVMAARVALQAEQRRPEPQAGSRPMHHRPFILVGRR